MCGLGTMEGEQPMSTNAERLRDTLARFRSRTQTRRVRQILGSQSNVSLFDLPDEETINTPAELWRYFSSLRVEPFSTLTLSSSDNEFKEWVTGCYSQTDLQNPVFISFADMSEAPFVRVDMLSVGDWLLDSRKLLPSEGMNFDVMIAASGSGEAVEFWEEEHHYSAYRKLPNL
jgi:hypothetical protein